MSDADNKIAEIRARHVIDQRWRNGPSMICPQSHDDRAFLLDEDERLRARVEVLERLTRKSLNVLTCDGGDDDPGHRCSHCDDYVDRNRQHRNALRAALKEAKP
jgi:hypothetical protein